MADVSSLDVTQEEDFKYHKPLACDSIDISTRENIDNKLSVLDNISPVETTNSMTESTSNTVYGNKVSIKKPCKYGNLFCLFYVEGQPLIMIGPQCIFIII